tara:strand:- start:3070 stop:3801 length:732 start_codon:yes stop_codon:yes gene_type:complete
MEKEYTINGIKIELFPFNKTFAQYTAGIASDKRKYFVKPTTEIVRGTKTGERMKWDRHETMMIPQDGLGDYASLSEKDFPDEGPKTKKDFQQLAEEYARQFLEVITWNAERQTVGSAEIYLDPAEVSYDLGATWESWYYDTEFKCQEVTDTCPADHWLGGSFARLTLVDPVLIEKVHKAAAITKERNRLEEIESKARWEAKKAEEAKEAARAEAAQLLQKVRELERQLSQTIETRDKVLDKIR